MLLFLYKNSTSERGNMLEEDSFRIKDLRLNPCSVVYQIKDLKTWRSSALWVFDLMVELSVRAYQWKAKFNFFIFGAVSKKPTLRRGREETVFPRPPSPTPGKYWLKNNYAFPLSGIKIFLTEMWTQRAQELLFPRLERSLLTANLQESWPLWCQRPEILLLNQNHDLSPGQRNCPPQTHLMFPHLPVVSHMAPHPRTLVSLFSIHELLLTLQGLVHMAFPQDVYISGVPSSSFRNTSLIR